MVQGSAQRMVTMFHHVRSPETTLFRLYQTELVLGSPGRLVVRDLLHVLASDAAGGFWWLR